MEELAQGAAGPAGNGSELPPPPPMGRGHEYSKPAYMTDQPAQAGGECLWWQYHYLGRLDLLLMQSLRCMSNDHIPVSTFRPTRHLSAARAFTGITTVEEALAVMNKYKKQKKIKKEKKVKKSKSKKDRKEKKSKDKR